MLALVPTNQQAKKHRGFSIHFSAKKQASWLQYRLMSMETRVMAPVSTVQQASKPHAFSIHRLEFNQASWNQYPPQMVQYPPLSNKASLMASVSTAQPAIKRHGFFATSRPPGPVGKLAVRSIFPRNSSYTCQVARGARQPQHLVLAKREDISFVHSFGTSGTKRPLKRRLNSPELC